MSTKTTAKKAIGADSAKSKNSKKVVTNKAGMVTGVTNNEIIENAEVQPIDNAPEQNITVSATDGPKVVSKAKAKSEKKVTNAKPATNKPNSSKVISIGSKKIRLAATCYHYYRGWLKEWLRANGAPSAKFSKAEIGYTGHITVIETQRAQALRALDKWKKENPDTKEMFWDVKK